MPRTSRKKTTSQKKPNHSTDLGSILRTHIPAALGDEFMRHYDQLRRDVLIKTFERTSPGKLVETFLRILQWMESGQYDKRLDVEGYFRRLDMQASTLDDGLRICGGRVARAMYAIRSKRNIAHTGDVAPNEGDLRFLFAAAQWLLAELLRVACSVNVDEAARMVAIGVPNVGLVDGSSGKVLLLADVSVTDEILLRLHHDYPAYVPVADIYESLDRRKPETVRRLLHKLWADRDVEGSTSAGYRLTDKGLQRASSVIEKVS
jgi:hypothetical protein